MRIWLVAAGLLLLLLAFNLLYVKVKFSYDLRYVGQEKSIKLVFIPIFDRFRWEKNITAPGTAGDWINIAAGVLEKKSADDQPVAKKQAPANSKRNKPARFLDVPIKDYYKLFRMFMSHLVLVKFTWQTSIGLDDPMHTALACGGIWTIKGNFIGIFSHYSSIEQVDLQVWPVYDDSGLSSKLDSIFKIRIVYIMFIIILASIISIRGYIDGYSARKAQPSH
ncbi:MAG: DUF2953 domain-containing protein [Syntrophomonadaceae bacterium]|nr:DUF2953 domain-containing protein [Syntrophomonadaceae bacterium]